MRKKTVVVDGWGWGRALRECAQAEEASGVRDPFSQPFTHALTHAEGDADGGKEVVVGGPALEGVAVHEREEHEHDHALAQPDEGLVVAVLVMRRRGCCVSDGGGLCLASS